MKARLALLLILLPAPALSAPRDLTWLPPDTSGVVGGPGTGAPLLRHFGTVFAALRRPQPACWTRMMESVSGSYQVWHAQSPDKDPVIVAHGNIERGKVEACLAEAFVALGGHARFSRLDSITRIEDPQEGTAYLGWNGHWAIWGKDRTWIETLLSAIDGKAKPAPITAVLRRIDGAPPFWFGVLQDYGKVFLGVSSRSVFGGAAETDTGKVLRITFEFESAAVAKKAAAALLARGAALPEPLPRLVADVKRTIKGSMLTLEMDGRAWLAPDAVAALTQMAERAKAGR